MEMGIHNKDNKKQRIKVFEKKGERKNTNEKWWNKVNMKWIR